MGYWQRILNIPLCAAIAVVAWIGFLRPRDDLANPAPSAVVARKLAQLTAENRSLREATAERAKTGIAFEPGPRAPAVDQAAIRNAANAYIADLVRESKIVVFGTRPFIDKNSPFGQRSSFTLGNDGFPAPGFDEFYGLGPGEMERLRGRLEAFKAGLQEAALAASRARPTDENSYIIDVQPIARSQERFSEFASIFREILGADRYRTFALLNGERETGEAIGGVLAQRFGAFGRNAMSITVNQTSIGYGYRILHTAPDGAVTSSGGSARTRADLAAAIGPATAALPETF